MEIAAFSPLAIEEIAAKLDRSPLQKGGLQIESASADFSFNTIKALRFW
ncbi:MAG: hypothetical protein HC895_05990 [Leptolyngbyaceae cyanobacterium SM1_3_5]|nr:hypothetical protein [Leptolyngbyaceae cyanobacterium SM1_3_5]